MTGDTGQAFDLRRQEALVCFYGTQSRRVGGEIPLETKCDRIARKRNETISSIQEKAKAGPKRIKPQGSLVMLRAKGLEALLSQSQLPTVLFTSSGAVLACSDRQHSGWLKSIFSGAEAEEANGGATSQDLGGDTSHGSFWHEGRVFKQIAGLCSMLYGTYASVGSQGVLGPLLGGGPAPQSPASGSGGRGACDLEWLKIKLTHGTIHISRVPLRGTDQTGAARQTDLYLAIIGDNKTDPTLMESTVGGACTTPHC